MTWRFSRVWMGVLVGALGGCGGGDAEGETCLSYACASQARVGGKLEVSEALVLVDASFCNDGECRTTLVDVTSARDGFCEENAAGVCAILEGTELMVDASWGYGEDGPPRDGTEFRLVLTDHETGEVLLDEVRSSKAQITRQDNCHLCWHAEMEL